MFIDILGRIKSVIDSAKDGIKDWYTRITCPHSFQFIGYRSSGSSAYGRDTIIIFKCRHCGREFVAKF